MSINKTEHITCLLGKTVKNIYINEDKEVIFHVKTNNRFNDEVYKMFHEQDCCENVYLACIDGNLCDLIGEQLVVAECVSHSSETNDGSKTWTFYRFATTKGFVVLRWCGESNGYYSESVDIVKL